MVQPQKTQKNRRKWRTILTLSILGLAVYFILPQITAIENSWKVLLSLIPWGVALALFSQFLSYVGSAYLLQKTLAITGQKTPLFKGFLMVLGAGSISLVAGGYVGSAAAIFDWTSDKKASLGSATIASLFPSIVNSIVLVLFSIFGLIHLILVHDLTRMQLIGFVITLVILTLIVGLFILASHYRSNTVNAIVCITKKWAKLGNKSFDPSRLSHEVYTYFTSWDMLWKGGWYRLILGAFLNVIFDIASLYCLFIAAGHQVTISVLLSGYAIPILLGRIAFILPGGVGVVETSMVGLYTALGAPKTTAVIVVEVYRLISFWIPTLIGFPIAAYLQRKTKKI